MVDFCGSFLAARLAERHLVEDAPADLFPMQPAVVTPIVPAFQFAVPAPAMLLAPARLVDQLGTPARFGAWRTWPARHDRSPGKCGGGLNAGRTKANPRMT